MARDSGSGAPLERKLGLKAGQRVLLERMPADVEIPAVDGVTWLRRLGPRLDVVLTFHTERATLQPRFEAAAARLVSNGMLWVCWPKQASGVPTDLDGNVVRELGLDSGLVDVKVAAIDATWSGLKFVRRLDDR